MEFQTVDRPTNAATTLPQSLIDALAQTKKTGKAISIKAPADPKKAKRLSQRLAGLYRRGVTSFRVRTLRQDDEIIAWAEDVRRGKPGRPRKHPLPEPDPNTPPESEQA